MLKKILIALTLSSLVLLGNYAVQSAAGRNRGGESSQKTAAAATGTLQKMIVENGSVTMDLDLNRLNASTATSGGRRVACETFLFAATRLRYNKPHFATSANSFFPVLVFNNQLRGPIPGSMALIPVEAAAPAAGVSVSQATRLPLQLGASLKQLAVEKLPSGQGTDLAVRDSRYRIHVL